MHAIFCRGHYVDFASDGFTPRFNTQVFPSGGDTERFHVEALLRPRPLPPFPGGLSLRTSIPRQHHPNSSRAVTPNASVSRPMTTATHVSPISSRTPSHDGPKDTQLSPGTHARTTREAVQKGTPPTTVVPSSMCLDGQARYIIRPMSSKVSRLSSVPVSRHMVTGTVTAPATPRQTPMSARAPSRDSPADAHKRFTMVDASHGSHGPSHVAPASPEVGRFEEISGTRQQVANTAQKTSVAATYHLLAKRKKDAPPPPASPKPGASTLDQRPIERAAAKVKESNMANVSNPKITPRQVLASPHYGVRQVITPRLAGSPVSSVPCCGLSSSHPPCLANAASHGGVDHATSANGLSHCLGL